jgi:competence protein ComEC
VDDERGVSLLLSMALGYRDVLSPSVEQAFSSLGLTHLLVVSGYQVSMVFGFVMAIGVMAVPRTSVFRYWREACTALGLTVAGLYVAFIGAEMSATRALIAAAFVCSERLCESRSGFAQRWCVALLLMQLVWPYCVFDIGVILTFAALAGIGVGASIGGKRKMMTWIMVTCSVWAFTSVVVVAWSGSFSLLSVPLNLVLAAPWSALNCTIGLVSLLGTLAGLPGASYALDLVVCCNSVVSEALTYIAQSPLAGWQLADWRRWCTCAALCALSALLGMRAVAAKREEV